MVENESVKSQAKVNSLASNDRGRSNVLASMNATKSGVEKELGPFSRLVNTAACPNSFTSACHRFASRKERARPLADIPLAVETDEDFWLAFDAEN